MGEHDRLWQHSVDPETTRPDWGGPLHRDGWTLDCRQRDGRRWWYVVNPDGAETEFETDGGQYLAVDMANAVIDGRSDLR